MASLPPGRPSRSALDSAARLSSSLLILPKLKLAASGCVYPVDLGQQNRCCDFRAASALGYLGMQPEVATGETMVFPSTVSALTDDAPHVQGA